MENVKVSIIGVSPLLLHNAALLTDPLSDVTKAMKAVSKKRVKTDDDHEEMARLEFMAAFYLDSDGNVIMPKENTMAMLVEAAKKTRRGKDIKSGVIVPHDSVIVHDGPKEPEKLWKDKRFVSRMTVRVTTNRVIRTRPRFDEWALEFTAMLDTRIMDVADLLAIVETAGMQVGMGDYRPQYGRFEVVR